MLYADAVFTREDRLLRSSECRNGIHEDQRWPSGIGGEQGSYEIDPPMDGIETLTDSTPGDIDIPRKARSDYMRF